MENLRIYKTIVEGMYEGVYFVDLDRRITFWNKGAERITGFTAAEVIGKGCDENILVHMNGDGNELCCGGCPLARSIREQCEHKIDHIYLHHKDGHRIPVSVSVSTIRDKSGKITGAVEMFHEELDRTDEQESVESLRKAALIDQLTGVPNRRYLEMNLASSLNEFNRVQLAFGLIFVDVDHFKAVNDAYGHDQGDRVLKLVASTLGANLRSYDMIGRWGGEEFVLIIRYVTEEQLRRSAEKMRILVANSFVTWKQKERISVTITLGGTMVDEGDTAETILKRADRLLYEGKEGGRNLVVIG